MVLSLEAFVGDLLRRQTAELTASAQKSFGIPVVFNILLVVLAIIQFFLSATLFCCELL